MGPMGMGPPGPGMGPPMGGPRGPPMGPPMGPGGHGPRPMSMVM